MDAKPTTTTDEMTRLQVAATRAAETLLAIAKGNHFDVSDAIQGVAFDLLRSWRMDDVESSAKSIAADLASGRGESDLDDAIHSEADRMATYTRDNLATIIGSDAWQAAFDDGDMDEPNWAAIAYAANAADLRRFMQAERA